METRFTAHQDPIGISNAAYQNRVASCIQTFLKNFQATTKSYCLTEKKRDEADVRLRVNDHPPSVQIRQLPQGGQRAGIMRIQQKMQTEHNTLPLFSSGGTIEIPNHNLVVASEGDLTRECILLTLKDEAIHEILASGLIAPQRVAEILEAVRSGHPNYFIVVQRYIMGIERQDGLQVPYTIIENNDERTFSYIEHLAQLS